MQQLFGERILARPIPARLKTEAGLIIPDAFATRSKLALIVMVGDAVPDLKVGETVVYNPDSGLEVDHNGERLLLLSEADFYGVL